DRTWRASGATTPEPRRLSSSRRPANIPTSDFSSTLSSVDVYDFVFFCKKQTEPLDFSIFAILDKHRPRLHKPPTIPARRIGGDDLERDSNSTPRQWLGVHHQFSLEILFGLPFDDVVELNV